jgi:hypothetical protein
MILDSHGRRLRRSVGFLPRLEVERVKPEPIDGGDVDAIGFRVFSDEDDCDEDDSEDRVTVGNNGAFLPVRR